MKTEEIIEMAHQAYENCDHIPNLKIPKEFIERFAKLVAEAEREACAKEAEDSDHVVGGRGYYDQLGDADATVRNIVAAIRARRRA